MKAVEAFKAEAAEYVVRLASRPQDKLVLEKEAALRWDNPARTGEDGALFIWMLGGRPEMIGTIFTYRFKDTLSRKHEFHSLATGPLAAEFRGKSGLGAEQGRRDLSAGHRRRASAGRTILASG